MCGLETGSQHGDPSLWRPTHPGFPLWLPGMDLLMCLKHQGSKEEFQKRSSSSTWFMNIFHKGFNKYLSAWTPQGMRNSLTAHSISGETYCHWRLSRNRLDCSLHPRLQIVLWGPHRIYSMPVLLCYGSLIILQLERKRDRDKNGGRDGEEERE